MNEAEFAALNEHLEELRPLCDAFCARHGFVYVDRKALGRYPRIRIEKTAGTQIWFDLWMDYDKDGQRFEQFSRDLPYELSAGAYVDVPDGSKYGVRFSETVQCFSGKPFEQVGAALETEMEKLLPRLEEWDAQHLRDKGKKASLGT